MADTYQQRLQENNRYYDRFAEQVRQRTEKRSYDRAFKVFMHYADKHKPVLDIGCGAGIHLKTFQSAGYEAIGVEPSEKMRKLAIDEGLTVVDGTFETLSLLDLPKMGGVWCAASLLHVPESECVPVLNAIHALLADGGVLYATVRFGEGGQWDCYDQEEGTERRFIQLFPREVLLDALEKSKLTLLDEWTEESTWGRPVPWISLFAIKQE